MEIHITRQSAPTIPDHINEELLADSPRTFMVWNSRYRWHESREEWEPRWEIWKELVISQHPDARNQLAESDRWNSEHQCWMRKLQTYHTADGEFAPVDDALLIGLRMADGWHRESLYEEAIIEPELAEELAQKKHQREIAYGARSYTDHWDKPIVGRHANSGWRHRIR